MKMLVVLVALGVATAAAADDLAAARQHYQKGTALYELSKFHDAATEYEKAYEAKSDPALLFNIGQAYRLAGEREAALRSYRSYLRKVPDAANRVEVEGYIDRLQHEIDDQKAAAARAAPAPPPTSNGTSAPSAPATAASQTLVTQALPSAHEPVYKKWWLWTAVAAVAVGVGVGLAVGLTPNNASGPANTVGVALH